MANIFAKLKTGTGALLSALALSLLLASAAAVADPAAPDYADINLILPVEQLNASKSSFDFDWRHAKVGLEHDDLYYGLRLNKGELSVGNSDSGWKTTLDLPDQQIKFKWNF